MIFDPRLPVNSDITAVIQSAFWSERCGLSGINSVIHVNQLCLGCMLHTTEVMMWLLVQPPQFAEQHCWRSGSGPQSHAAPHKLGKFWWNAVRTQSEIEGPVLLPPAMAAHLRTAGVPERDGSHCSCGTTSSCFLRERHKDSGKDLASSPGIRKVEKNAFSLI